MARVRTAQRRRGTVVSLAAAVALAASAPAVLGADVVINGGAEADVGSDHSGERVVRPSGWQTIVGGMSVQRYGRGGFPGGGGGGSNLFTGGRSSTSSMRQATSIVAGARAIDAGGQTARLSAKLGGYSTQDDHATVTAEFLDANGARLSAIAIGPVTRSDRGDETTLIGRAASGPIPPGARTVVVTVTATRAAGVSNDGYADDVALDLSVAAGGTTAPERVIPRFLSSRNPTMSYTTASGAKLTPPITIVRHGARVRLCNRSPVFRKPFLGIPSGAFVLTGKARDAVSVTIPPRRCVRFFSRLLAPRGAYMRGLAKLRTRRAAVARRQIARGFDRRTGRLLAPRRKGKRGVCWRIFDRIDGDLLTAIYVLPKGQRQPLPADVRAARACRPNEPPAAL